jgi:hypothetical protein
MTSIRMIRRGGGRLDSDAVRELRAGEAFRKTLAHFERRASMIDRARCRRDLEQRSGEIARTWRIAEYPDNIQFIARNGRPAKRNRTHIAENGHQTLGAFDGGALIDATHRHAGDDIVVNRYKRQRRKFWKPAGQRPISHLLSPRSSISKERRGSHPTMAINTPRFGSPPATQWYSPMGATTVSTFRAAHRCITSAFSHLMSD